MDDLKQDPFKEYLKATEPDKRSKTYAWATAIGLQAVDGLTPSKYLLDTAVLNIEGKITLKEAKNVIESYYEQRPSLEQTSDDRTEEADKVSVRIAEILSEPAFSFTSTEYLSIHRRLFQGIYKHAGKIRDYNITKKEWVLNGETVTYGSATELKATLEYDISRERKFNYDGLNIDDVIKHLARFVSRLWQIHVFGEGNTRTTAVFFIKYLRMLGFSADNDLFADNAWYFRNALVRANYTNLKKGVSETTEFLEVFLRNLLLKENNPLHNRYLHVDAERLFGDFLKSSKKVDIGPKKVDIGAEKVDIGPKKVDIGAEKVDIGPKKVDIGAEKVDIGPKKVDIGAEKVDIGPKKVDIGAEKVDIGPKKVDIGAEKVDIGPKKVDIGAEKVDIGPKKVDIESEKVDIESEKVDIESEEVDIESEEVDIESEKVDVRARNERFEKSVSDKIKDFNVQTVAHVYRIFVEFGYDGVFGRGAIVKLLSLKNSSASKLLSKLLLADVIESVSGFGKGKYKFKD